MSHSSLPALLIHSALLTQAQLDAAHDATSGTDVTWLEHLIATGALDDRAVCALVAETACLQRSDPQQLGAASPTARACLPPAVAIEHRVLPLAIDSDGYLVVAMVDPTDTAAVAEIGFFSGRAVLREVAGATAIACALHHYYDAPSVLWPRRSPRAAAAPAPTLSAGA